MAGKADDVAHPPVKDDRGIPVVAMDYAFTAKDEKPIVVRYDEEDRVIMAMCVHKEGHLMGVAHLVQPSLGEAGTELCQ